MGNPNSNPPSKGAFSNVEIFLSGEDVNIKTIITRYDGRIYYINSGEGLWLTYDLFRLDESPMSYICSQVCTHQNYLDFLSMRLALSRREVTSRFRGGEDLESYLQINAALLEGKTFLKETPLKMIDSLTKFTKRKLEEWRELQDNLCWVSSNLVEISERKRNVREKIYGNGYNPSNKLVN